MTIKETMRKGMLLLKGSGISEPNLKARLLLQYILNKPRQYLIVHDNDILTLRQDVDYFKAIKKIINRSTTSAYNSYARIYENEFLC